MHVPDTQLPPIDTPDVDVPDPAVPGMDLPETKIPPSKDDPGMRAVDDHVAGTELGLGHQPTDGLDSAVDDEHLSSSS
jgi:hypothetical protein